MAERQPIEQMVPDEDGWSDWIHPLPGYLVQCCGCDLIHEMQVAITELHDAVSVANEGEDAGHIVVFRMRNASADTRPKGGDALAAPFTSGAVPKADAQ